MSGRAPPKSREQYAETPEGNRHKRLLELITGLISPSLSPPFCVAYEVYIGFYH